MKSANAARARRHLDKRFTDFGSIQKFVSPPRGWIRAVRDALGMTAADLGRRMGVSQAAVAQFEKSEKDGSITVKTLRSAAEALDCTLIYALVPRTSLDDLMMERASIIADEQLARTHHTMSLENQALLPDDLKAERKRLVDDILRDDPARLWR
jgi:predicted DNA-binding mobile mystery protein A